MAMTLTGFVYDNAGNAISGATVQGYVSADAASSTAEDSVTTDSNGKWAITTSTASRVPMDVKITYGSNVRWIKAGDKVNVTDMTVTGTLTVGEDDSGFDVKLYGATSGSFMFWDESDDTLKLTDSTPLKIGDGSDMTLYHNGSDSYITNATGALRIATENSGIAVTIGHTTSEVTIGQNLTVTGTLTLGSGAELSEAELEMLDGITAGTAAASKALVLDANKDIGTIRNLTIDGTLSDGNYTFDTSGNVSGLGTVASGAITTSGVLDITDATDSSDATGDTGALRTEGGASIAKKLYVGDDASVGGNLTVTGNLNIDGTTTTVDSTTVAVGDSMISLAKDQGTSADAVDFGIYGTYGVGGTAKYAGIFRDLSATGDPWTFFDTLEAEPGTTVNTSGTGYDLADISAGGITAADGFTGDLTGDVTGNADTATALATGRTIAMTGDVAWTSASFDGSGNVTGAGTIQANAVEGSMLNTNVISGQTEITSGLAAADELLYDDGGVLKKVGLDTLTSYLAGVNAGTVTSTGISDSSGVLTVDIQNMTASTTIADADLVVVDDGANGTLRKMTRANFIESAALDAINIDGGAIDGAVIGANDAAAGTFAALVSTTFAPSDDVTLASHKYLNLPENSSIKFTDQIGVDNSIDNDDGQGIIFTFRAGATVTPFSPVYIDGNNEVQECNANAIATMPCIGVTMNTSDVSADADIEVMMLGLIRHDSFSDFGAAGAPVYASGTAGALTTTAPSGTDDVVQVVGHSIAEDLIFVQPCLTTIEHA